MVTYYLLVPFLYLLSYLPSSVLYKLSNVLAFVLRSIIRYRHEVVYTNLRNSFPNKNQSEIKKIADASYTHLADRVVENIKCLTINIEEVNERIQTQNPEVLETYYHQKRNIVLMVGHIASWEYAGYKLSSISKHQVFAIVSRIKNKYFNRLIQRTRGKMGMHLVTMQTVKDMFRKDLNEPSIGVFISDQSPPSPQRAYWTDFLHQQTAFFTGAERYARQHDCVVLYVKIWQTKRGYYSSSIQVISEHAQKEEPSRITETFARLMESHLNEYPADWLWSHKRWKHKKRK